MKFEIIYALPNEQKLLSIDVADDSLTVLQAVIESKILSRYPEIDMNVNKVGIFGQKVSLDTIIKEGDRIEIYRSLKIDPKLARKKRVKQKPS